MKGADRSDLHMDGTDLAIISPKEHHIPILGMLPEPLHAIGAGDGGM